MMVLVASVGLAVASEGESDAPAAVGRPSAVDPEATREAAVAYLMSKGVSEQDAESRISRQSAQIAAATRLRRQAPDDIRSVWIDDDGVLTASVATERGAALARASGAVPVFVTFASAELEAARDTLIDDVINNPPPGFSGAAFEIDESSGMVSARYFFETTSGVVPAAATQLADIVQASTDSGRLSPTVGVPAGYPMVNHGGICTLGWAVDIVDSPDPGDRYQGAMTAGHCFTLDVPPEDTVFSIGTPMDEIIAGGVEYRLGAEGDYGYLELGRDGDSLPAVETPVGRKFVKELGDPVEGATVCKFGIATQETCGQIQHVDVSVVIAIGGTHVLLSGMVRTSYCALRGDSGGPVYASFTGFGSTDSSITAIGLQSMTLLYFFDDPDNPGSELAVCGEHVNAPNESYFMPLSGIDNDDRFFVKIDGG